jgi:predicted ATPase
MFTDNSNIKSREDSSFPFDKLDQSAKTLRAAASELADVLHTITEQSPELTKLIEALKSIHTINIQKINVALASFKNIFAELSIRNKDTYIFGASVTDDQLGPIVDKYVHFISETMALSENAFELDK